MCTVLITYSTPQPPGETTAAATVPTDEADHRATPAPGPLPAEPSFAATTAGIDEAIAATVADELTRAGHRVACRPSVAVTTTNGFDLVVAVHHLRVSHSNGGRPRHVDPEDPEGAAGHGAARSSGDQHPDEASTIPMTWCADWRAVDAWARSVGDHLVHVLELRTELARVQAELDRCRAMLRAATPEPRALSAVELGRPTARNVPHGSHRAHRPAAAAQPTGA
ncbi:hypothetical protein GCM10009868_25420 [Terrabacter aerolatus]|uniref:Uncharacterized protein n=1 Tax=Terrabacter aerolatus TaxID=422442 RepID=A0A512D147_9MICO|nr:hypothetical protein [Terrabacter aerolatus]GEO30193.1 hypothetical protein TAE01_20030 [Terrabacter aerolatus]